MSIQLLDYTEKSIAVFGPTTPYKDYLSNIGGKFNPGLTHPLTKAREAGWIFTKTKRDVVQTFIDQSTQGQLPPPPVNVSKEKVTKTKSDEFELTKEMYLALVSRIEKLENENANLLQSLQNQKFSEDDKKILNQTAVKQNTASRRLHFEDEEEEESPAPRQSFLFKK
jgi:uncharacterized protein (UPF0335 family)